MWWCGWCAVVAGLELADPDLSEALDEVNEVAELDDTSVGACVDSTREPRRGDAGFRM